MAVPRRPDARSAALPAGGVDLIEPRPVECLECSRGTAGVDLLDAPSANIIRLSFDQQLEPSPALSGTDGRNPFKDVRVRRRSR